MHEVYFQHLIDIYINYLVNEFVQNYYIHRYHVGSVALGSLLIATIRFIRIVLEYIDRKCRKYANNIIAKAILW